MREFRWVAALIIVLLTQGITPAMAADSAKEHRIATGRSNDPKVMDLALENAGNAVKYYK
jgi:hypothetical protein